MNRLLIYLAPLFFIGCKTDDKVEIYLLKKRVAIVDGIPYTQVHDISNKPELKEYEFSKYDTIFDVSIHAGRFTASQSDLQTKPFIADDEILSFNLKNNKFIFSPKVVERLAELPGNMHSGTQFVITVNKKPELTGYFMHMSVWCDWYYIRFFKEGEGSQKENKASFELFNGAMRGKHEDLTPPYPKELLEAFRSSGRLLE